MTTTAIAAARALGSWLELLISIPSIVSSKLLYKMMMLTINHDLKIPLSSIMFMYFYNNLTKNIR